MIGGPSNFQHLTHMDKSDANRVRGSKVGCSGSSVRSAGAHCRDLQEMAEITAALKLPPGNESEKSNELPTQAHQLAKEAGAMPEASRASSPTCGETDSNGPSKPKRASIAAGNASANGKRKAPPPVTQSIIKAAGLPMVQSAAAVPSLPSATIAARQNLRQPRANVEVQTVRPDDAGDIRAMPVRTSAAVSNTDMDRLEALSVGQVPATNSSIQRSAIGDIERLLRPNLDGLPSSSADAASLPSAPGAPMPAYVPPVNGVVRSSTYQDLAISPSMENVLSAAVTVEGTGEQQPQEKRPGPLEYMTDTTKAKWDGQMEDIARQLRERTD